MATFRANAAGEILQFLATAQQEQQNPNPPAGTAYTLRFDETTNAGIVTAYNANSNTFAMPGGTLTQSGTPVTINPPGLLFEALENAAALATKAVETNDAFTRQEVAWLIAIAFRSANLPL